MVNALAKTVDSANLTEQERSLIEAYAQSAGQDKLIATDFEAVLLDGLMDKRVLNRATV